MKIILLNLKKVQKIKIILFRIKIAMQQDNFIKYIYQQKAKPHFIINADDFGYYEEKDKGIVELYKNGLITSCSMLMNGKNIKNSIFYWQTNLTWI